MPFVKANDISIYYEIYGEGPPLFLVAGLSQHFGCWKEMIPSLSKHFQVIAFDNRGSGQTEAPNQSYSIKMFVEDTAALMNALKIEAAHFLGQSMGSMIIQKMCIDHPDRVKKAVLVGPFAHFWGVSKNNLQSQIELLTSGIEKKAIVRLNASWLLSNQFFEVPGNLESYMKEVESDPYPQTMEGLLGQADALMECDLREEIKKIPHEILLLIGEEDIATPPACEKLLKSGIARSKSHTFKDMGHMFVYEIPGKVAKYTIDFLLKA